MPTTYVVSIASWFLLARAQDSALACRKLAWCPWRCFRRNADLNLGRLAYCELYVTLGTFFHHYADMELDVFETTPEDLGIQDFFSSYYIAGKKWFKAVGHR